MNKQWNVNYTLYEDRNHVIGQPGMMSQNMVVTADSPSQARTIVESMFNGLAGSIFVTPLN